MFTLGFPAGSVIKESACNAGTAGDTRSIPGSGRSPGGGHGNPLQYSCLENPMDRAAWRAIVHGVAELDMTEATQHTHRHTCAYFRKKILVQKKKKVFSQYHHSAITTVNILMSVLRDFTFYYTFKNKITL